MSPTPAGMPVKAAVLAHLPECQIVHFACHGASDPTDPPKAGCCCMTTPATPSRSPASPPSNSALQNWPTCPPAAPPSPAPRGCSMRPSTSRQHSSSPGSRTSSAPCGRSTTPQRSPLPAPSTQACAPLNESWIRAGPPTPSTMPCGPHATTSPPPHRCGLPTFTLARSHATTTRPSPTVRFQRPGGTGGAGQ